MNHKRRKPKEYRVVGLIVSPTYQTPSGTMPGNHPLRVPARDRRKALL
jgi:hypothetical protein